VGQWRREDSRPARGIIASAPLVFAKYRITIRACHGADLPRMRRRPRPGRKPELHGAARDAGVAVTLSGHGHGGPYAGNPRALANTVYDGRMGNAAGSDDSWNFRGRDAAQHGETHARAASAEWVSYGASVQNILVGATAGGTSASPTGTPATRNIFNLRGYGYNGSAWSVGGLIVIRSGDSGVWSGSNQGTQVDFYTTPNGTTALALAGSFNPKGGLRACLQLGDSQIRG
jgi:hypothetical protein